MVQPLKLVVTIVSAPLPVETLLPVEPVQLQTEFSSRPCHRGRGGHCQRSERPRCEERKKWREEKLTLTKEERIQHKTAKISERIKHIEAVLLNDLPAHRQRALNWRLEKLQSKLEFLQLMTTPDQTPTDSEPTCQTVDSDHFDGRRGCHSRRGRGCGGRKAFEHNPEGCGRKWDQFDDQVWECRKNMRAARDSGNQDEIDRCFQALHDAKSQKWNAKREGRPEKKFFQEKLCKRECLNNLRQAKAAGEQEKIKECELALSEAREALKTAKVACKC